VDLFLLEDTSDFGGELVEQYSNRVVIDIGGMVGQHLAGEMATGSRSCAAASASESA